jgi:hypothetical protein
MPPSGACGLADLYQVAIGVAQKAADLRAPVIKRGEEGCAPGAECLIGRLAVRTRSVMA